MQVVKADSGKDVLIWVVLAIIWVIAQLASKLKQGKNFRPPPVLGEEPSLEEDLDQFFATLNKSQQPEPPRPPPPGVQAPGPQPQRRKTVYVEKTSAKRVRTMPLSDEIPVQPLLASAEPTPSHPVLADSIVHGSPGQSWRTFTSAKWPSMTLASSPTHRRRQNLRIWQITGGRRNLQNAVLSRVILGPPKALG